MSSDVPTGISLPNPFISCQDLLREDAVVHGWMRMRGSSFWKGEKWRMRYIVLQDGCLYVFKDELARKPEHAESLYGYTQVLAAKEVFSREVAWPFKIVNEPRLKQQLFYFAVTSAEDQQRWMDKFREELVRANDPRRNPLSQHYSIIRLHGTGPTPRPSTLQNNVTIPTAPPAYWPSSAASNNQQTINGFSGQAVYDNPAEVMMNHDPRVHSWHIPVQSPGNYPDRMPYPPPPPPGYAPQRPSNHTPNATVADQQAVYDNPSEIITSNTGMIPWQLPSQSLQADAMPIYGSGDLYDQALPVVSKPVIPDPVPGNPDDGNSSKLDQIPLTVKTLAHRFSEGMLAIRQLPFRNRFKLSADEREKPNLSELFINQDEKPATKRNESKQPPLQDSIQNAPMYLDLEEFEEFEEFEEAEYQNTDDDSFEEATYSNETLEERATFNGDPKEAQRKMSGLQEDGVYMIRTSTSKADSKTLMVRVGGKIKKYSIDQELDGRYTLHLDGMYFDNLEQLLQFYHDQNLPCLNDKLIKPYTQAL